MALRPDWIFDNSAIDDPLGHGQRSVDFLNSLKHPKSQLPHQQFALPRFWDRVTRRIYGPKTTIGTRQIKTVFCLMPRGGRKTTWAAGLGLLHTVGYERRPDGQVISAASAEDQAKKAYDEATAITKATPYLNDSPNVKITESLLKIEHTKTGATFQSISSDGGAQLGSTPAFAIIDELIAWKNRSLWEAISTGMPKEPDSLMVIITQAGRGQENFAYEIYEYAKKVASGSIEDPTFLPIIFEPPEGADWRSEKLWHLVNPGLVEGFPDLEGLRAAAKKAEHIPSERDTFKQFNLNFWLDKSASPFVDMEVYDEGKDLVDIKRLAATPCWIAVDLGLVRDLSAIIVVWKSGDHGNEEYDAAAWFFCPEMNLQARADKDKVPYPRWAKDGFIIPTPGNVTDYAAITEFLRLLCKPGHKVADSYRDLFKGIDVPTLKVEEIAFDPAYAKSIVGPLTEEGLPTAEMRQGWITMAPAIKELERAIISHRFRHAGHPVLRWCFENVVVETDKAGNKTFHKGKSRDRIDGAVAAAMAVGRAHAGESQPKSFWETSDDIENLLEDDAYDVSKMLED